MAEVLRFPDPVARGARMAIYCERLVVLLEDSPNGLSSADLYDRLGPPGDVPYLPLLIARVRQEIGDELLVTEIDYSRPNAAGYAGLHVYRLAAVADQVFDYVHRRHARIRGECNHLGVMLGRAEVKFPAEAARIKVARKTLDFVADLLTT